MLISLLIRFWYFIPILLLAFSTWYYKTGMERTQRHYDGYKAEVRILGEIAEKAAKQKEAEYEQKIKLSMSNRLASYKRVREQSRERPVSITPAIAPGSEQICFDPPAFDAAIEQYRERVRRLVEQGDEAQIDAETLINAWPN